MCYILKNVFKTIRYKLGLNIVLIISFFIGLYAVFIVVSMADSLLQINFTMSLKNEYEVSITHISQSNESSLTAPINVKSIEALLSQYDFVKDKTIIENVRYSDILTDEMSVYYCVPDESFSDFHNFKISEGRFFNKDDYNSTDKVCVIEQQLMDTGKYQCGSNYMIENEAYKIVGIIYTAEYRGRVFLPKLRESDKIGPHYYDVAIRYNDLNDYMRINWESLNGSVDNKTAEKYRKDGAAYVQSVLKNFGIIAVVLMLYSLINSYNIIVNRITANSACYGIYLSVGASPKKIYMHIFAEISIYALSALLLIFIIEPIASVFIKQFIEHYVGVFSVCVMAFIALFISLIISLISARRIMKHSIVEMIKRLPI